MLRPTLCHTLSDAPNIIPVSQTLRPRGILRILAINAKRSAKLGQQALAYQVPCDERQVGECALVTNQPASATPSEAKLENADHALDLIRVTLDG